MMRLTFVIAVSWSLVLLTESASSDPPPIDYYCDVNTFHYNVTKIAHIDANSKFSYAIAEQDTPLTNLESDSQVNGCFRKFTKLDKAGAPSSLAGDLNGCQLTDQTKIPMLLYMDLTSLEENRATGGKSFQVYSLPCDTKGKKEIIVKNGFNNINSPSTLATEVPSILTMTVTVATDSNSTSTKTTGFIVGEPLLVKITQVHSSGKHTLKLKSCTSSSNNAFTPPTLDIIKDDHSSIQDVVPTLQAFENTGDGTRKAEIAFNMYAFKFYQSSEVYMKCDMFVCDDAACPITNRKRRSAGNDLTAVTTHFTVHEKQVVASGQPRRFPNVLAIATTVLLLLAAFV